MLIDANIKSILGIIYTYIKVVIMRIKAYEH